MSEGSTQTNIPTWAKYLVGALVAGTVVYVGGRMYLSSGEDESQNTEENLAKYGAVDDKTKKALLKKQDGNNFYKEKKYAEAIKSYEEGIKLCDSENKQVLSELHQNIAACYSYLLDSVNEIVHCTHALAFNPTFAKALKRRSAAYEKERKLKDAADDLIVLASLDRANAAEYQAKARELYTDAASIIAHYKFPKIPEANRPIPHQQMFSWIFHSSVCNPIANIVRGKTSESLFAGDDIFLSIIQNLRNHKFDRALEQTEEYLHDFSSEDKSKSIEGLYLVKLLNLKFKLVQRRFTLVKQMIADLTVALEKDDLQFDTAIVSKENILVTFKILQLDYAFKQSELEGDAFFEEHIAPYENNTDILLNYGIFKSTDFSSFLRILKTDKWLRWFSGVGISDMTSMPNNLGKIEEFATKSFAADPNNIFAKWYRYYGVSLNAMVTGDYGEFLKNVEEFDTAVTGCGYNQDSFIGWFFLSQLCAVSDQVRAIEILDKCRQIYPLNVVIPIVQVSLQPGPTDGNMDFTMHLLKMKKTCEEVLTIDPHNSMALKMFARILMEEGKLDEARSYLEKALDNSSSVEEYAEVSLDTMVFEGLNLNK
uniref:TPR_REGION domain-containing protein n=1 Tax=Rhabditophanes sp. KR3021 TaxID=114890 RepID=A0AC35U0D7_9BILA